MLEYKTRFLGILGLSLACLLNNGCSIRHYALNKAADALAKSGTTFSSDDDPDLIKSAAPFSLKLMESVLAENPRHPELLATTTASFVQYAYAFVQEEADETEAKDLAASEALRVRARKLYIRARNYGLRGLEVKHPGFEAALAKNPTNAVTVCTKSDVALLYWTSVAWGSAISLSKDNPDLIAELPRMQALIYRAQDLDESFGEGSIHCFLISFEMARMGASGDPVARARTHFDRAVALSKGHDATPMVALAESVMIQKQNAKEFEALLNQALAINPDQTPDNRLLNNVMQRRARWLLSRQSDLFVTE
jgi:predicted anti-sigma-YlaC factor YlaD